MSKRFPLPEKLKEGECPFCDRNNFGFYETETYGEISSIQFNKNLIRDTRNLHNEFVSLAKTIENDEMINKYIFPFLHMVNDYDYYGEDFLDGFCINNRLAEKVKDYLYDLDKD